MIAISVILGFGHKKRNIQGTGKYVSFASLQIFGMHSLFSSMCNSSKNALGLLKKLFDLIFFFHASPS
jgi:hypothetical protein